MNIVCSGCGTVNEDEHEFLHVPGCPRGSSEAFMLHRNFRDYPCPICPSCNWKDGHHAQGCAAA